jgi:hypothetical protein
MNANKILELAFLFSLPATAALPAVPVLSVCEVLDNRLEYNGKTVIVIGQFSSGMHGEWLDQECSHRLAIDGFEWPYEISLPYYLERRAEPPPILNDYQWNSPLLTAKLAEAQKTAELRLYSSGFSYKWVAVFGRFETLAKFPIDRYSKHPGGFGHVGEAAAELVAPQNGIFFELRSADRVLEEHLDLWRCVKSELMRPSGPDYFRQGMIGAQIPALRGTVIDRSPPRRLETLIVSLSGDNIPEATLKLDHPLKRDISIGQILVFKGVATEFTQSPFMLVFSVQSKNLFFERGKAPK